MPWATSELGLGPAPASSLPSRKVGRDAAVALPANQAQPGGHSPPAGQATRWASDRMSPTPGVSQGHALHTWETLGPGRSPEQAQEPQGGPSHPAGLADNHLGH